MSSYSFQVNQNPLSVILGIAGISIDAVCNDYSVKLYIRFLWKNHLASMKILDEKKIEEEKEHFVEYCKLWNKSIKESKEWRKYHEPRDKEYWNLLSPADVNKVFERLKCK